MNVTEWERLYTRGNQVKWFHDNKYVKLNTGNCYESISEILVSNILAFTDVKDYVKYYPCGIIEDRKYLGVGCYSNNFVKSGEICFSFDRFLDSSMSYDNARDKLLELTGVDIKTYIDTCLCIDAVTFNEDRHFGNFSIIYDGKGFRTAPVYDNGASCLSDVYSYPFDVSLVDNLGMVFAKPFKFGFEEQLKEAHVTPILIRYNDLINYLSGVEHRAVDVIKVGLERFKGLAWEKY